MKIKDSTRFLSLLNGEDTRLYQIAASRNSSFHYIFEERDLELREMQLNRYYDHMSKLFDQIRQTNNPALILAVEYAILLRDEWHLNNLVNTGNAPQFLQADITGNKSGKAAISGALDALDFQAGNSEIYHRIMAIGTSNRYFDKQNLALNIVRDAIRTQTSRLRTEMRGVNQSQMERKKCGFLEKRHENLLACGIIYKGLQRKAKLEREANMEATPSGDN